MSTSIPLILDGGLGTLLQSRGAFVQGDPLWSVRCLASPPESEGRRQLYQAHLDYLIAGANMIKTNSYQMTPDHLRKCLPGLSQVSYYIFTLNRIRCVDTEHADPEVGECTLIVNATLHLQKDSMELVRDSVRIARHACQDYWQSVGGQGKQP